MSFTLSAEELFELTGKRRYTTQARALFSMGIPYRLRPDGSPAVLRVHVEYETPPERPPSPEMRLP